MANPGCLYRRLVLALIQTPTNRCNPLHLTCGYSPTKHWIRTITSSPPNRSDTPSISFGKENDGVIAPYMGKSNKKGKAKKPRATDTAQSTANDDYEISGFIDRSEQKGARFAAPLEEALTTKNDKPVRQAAPRKLPSFRKVELDETHFRKIKMSESTSKTRAPGQPLERKKSEGVQPWMIQKNALTEKFDGGWEPRKKLSPDAMEGIRGLHEQDPIKYSTELLADQFKMSPEAIRRILKSKWLTRQSPEKLQERRERWARRHDRIWDAKAEIGLRPPRTKDREVEDPEKFDQDVERHRVLGKL